MKTEILGISQTYQWYIGSAFDFPITDFTFSKEKKLLNEYFEVENCQAKFGFGGDLTKWRDPNYDGYESEIRHNIRYNNYQIDRIIFTVSGETRTVECWVDDIQVVSNNLVSKYSKLKQIFLQPVIGGFSRNISVRATENQSDILNAIVTFISESNNPVFLKGCDCKIRRDFFCDAIGHLTSEGAKQVQNELYKFYQLKIL